MKKLLILILIALLVILSIYTVINGINIGSLKILGVRQLQTANDELDTKIEEIAKLADVDYAKAKDDVTNDNKELQSKKKEYEDLVTISTDEEIQTAKQFQKHKLEHLLVQLGKHATDEGVLLKLDIVKGNNTTSETYNINFTVTGSYVRIAEYIYAIENDSTLGFKIEEFKIEQGVSDTNLQAKFVCKNITILDMQENQTTTNTDNTTTTNSTNTNTTVQSNTTDEVNEIINSGNTVKLTNTTKND